MNDGRRWERLLGERAVPCLVSSRWLPFPTKSDFVGDGNYMFVDVMTSGDGQNARKLCQISFRKKLCCQPPIRSISQAPQS
jgi:hypothetical protein